VSINLSVKGLIPGRRGGPVALSNWRHEPILGILEERLELPATETRRPFEAKGLLTLLFVKGVVGAGNVATGVLRALENADTYF